MNSRERVKKAFGLIDGEPDRVPIQFDLCRQLTDYFSEQYKIPSDYTMSYYEDLTYRISANELRIKMGSDCVIVGGSVASNFVPEKISDTVYTNEFGMHMEPTSLYVEVVKAPLEGVETVEEIENYNFPDAYAPGRFDKAREDIAKYKDDYFVIGNVEISIFELAWHLTGMEDYMVAMTLEEDWVEALNDKVENWSLGLAKQLVEAGVDAIWFGEDLGTQKSTLMSPDFWRDTFKPRYKRMIKELKAMNPDLIVILHSDGAVAPLIEDFIDIGIDVYNPVQPNVPGSEPELLKEKFGEKINFFGGIDQQILLPSGNLEEIEKEIKIRKEILGRDGGYMLAPAHILQADVAPETVEAMIQFAMN